MDRDTKRQKTDHLTGELLFQIQVCTVTDDDGGAILLVKFTGTPHPGLKSGVAVRLTKLVAQDWQMGAKTGISFRASKVEPALATAVQKPGAAA